MAGTASTATRCLAAGTALAALLAACSAARAQGTAGSRPGLLTVQGCGKPLPMVVGNIDTFRQFQVDLDAYRRSEAAAFGKAVAGLCAESPHYRELIDRGVREIRVLNAQGADDPTPYLGGQVLIIEFVGGDVDQARLQHKLAKALDRGSVIKPSFDCARATRAVDQLICAEPDLARDDADLADSYKTALKADTAQPALAAKLRQEQRNWLTQRDAHCAAGANPRPDDAAVSCLHGAYRQRIEALNGVAPSPEPAKGSP